MCRLTPSSYRYMYAPFLAVLVILLISSCGINPVTGQREIQLLSQDSEIALGNKNYIPAQQAQGGLYYLDPILISYVREIGYKIAKVSDRPDLPYEFVILNNSVPNAWSMPGGKIAINRGILLELENEAELAAVLAHEIVHSAARHSAKSYERGVLLQAGTVGLGLALKSQKNADILLGTAAVAANLVNLKYSREQELESDFYGMQYMARAGYDPAAAVTLQEKFIRLNKDGNKSWLAGFFATHPPSEERLEANRITLSTLPRSGYFGADRYRDMMNVLAKSAPAYKEYDNGVKAVLAKQYDKALGLAEKAIKLDPREALFWSLKGEALAGKDDYRGALGAFDEALSRYKDYYEYYLNRAVIEQKLGMVNEAREDYNQSNKLLPTSTAHYGLGLIAEQQKQFDLALKHYAVVADSRTELAADAARRAVMLDMPHNPERYITADIYAIADSLKAQNNVSIIITNKAPVAVSNLKIYVNLLRNGRELIAREMIYVPVAIKPGGSYVAPTSMRISNEDRHRITVQYNVAGYQL